MSDYVKAAVLGTDDYHSVMRQAITHALQSQAGKPIEQADFTGYPVTAQRGQLISYKPKYGALTASYLADHFQGYGWVAGSAALYEYSNTLYQVDWVNNDIDVFCHSKAAYQEIINLKAEIISQDKRQTKVRGIGIYRDKHRVWIDDEINYVCPPDNADWSHPANVLCNFDLTCTQIALTQAGTAYILHPDHIVNRQMEYTGTTIAPLATLRRILKYMQRGFIPVSAFWYEVCDDKRMLPFVSILHDLNMLDDNLRKDVLSNIFWAMPSEEIEYSYDFDEDD